MKIVNKNNSIVLLAESHNPTLFSDSFLINSKIISKLEEINRNQTILTPLFVNIGFMDGASLQLDSLRFIISSDNCEVIANKAIAYIDALPHIKCSGIGINFDYTISEYDFKSFFDKYNNCNATNLGNIFAFDMKFTHNHGECFVKISLLNDSSAVFNFNFDYNISLVPFMDLDIKIANESKKNIIISNEFINKILG